MKLSRIRRGGLGRTLIVGAAAALAAAALVGAGASAHASTASGASGACSAALHAPAKIGHAGGFVRPVSTRRSCAIHNSGDPAIGDPPLLYHGGAMMSTAATNGVTITPIYWQPAGYSFTSSYKSIINKYVHDVASQSGKHTNVFSVNTEYYGTNGQIQYNVHYGTPIVDRSALAGDCTVGSADSSGIYADNSGYTGCVSDNRVSAETDSVVSARSLPKDNGHIYVLFLPKHVESCFSPGTTTDSSNECTINHYPSAAYCAYHSENTSDSMVYANMPFPIYHSSVGYSCTDEDLNGSGVIQAPNGNPDADVEISPTSHEVSEAITDPDVSTGWYDAAGYENGDECAYVYGALQGSPGTYYNQVIDHRHYLTQEEFSNQDFATSGGSGGCLQYE